MPAAEQDPIRAAIDLFRAGLQRLRQAGASPLAISAAELAISATDPTVDFGALLRERRDDAGWSIPELAQRAKLAENTLRNYEAGRTTPTPANLARLLGVPQLQLVAEHVEPPAPAPGHKPNAHFPRHYDPAALAQGLRTVVNGPGGVLEQSYLYLDNQSATDYLAVCEAYASTRGRLFAELQRLAEQIATDCGPLEVVAIGSGDGRAEVCLTRALADAVRVSKLYLLDISHTLLAKAYEHAALALGPDVEVEAVHGNFHNLSHYPVLHAGLGKPRHLYTLLGATLANLADELRFFRDLHSCTAAGDLVLLDFQIAHDPPENDPTLKAGAIPKIFFDWHAGPLRRNNPLVREIAMRAVLGAGRLSGSYACLSIADATMADGSLRTYQVMRSARFCPRQLGEALAALGWQTLHAAPYEPRTALMLLRRM